MRISTVGVDIAKNIFQVYARAADGQGGVDVPLRLIVPDLT